MKPEYVNKEITKVSEENLRKILKELHRRQQDERRQQAIDTAEALASGFRCMPNFYKR